MLLHVALRLNRDETVNAVARRINSAGLDKNAVLSSIDMQDLRRAVAMDIANNPTHRWIILAGSTIGQINPQNIIFTNSEPEGNTEDGTD